MRMSVDDLAQTSRGTQSDPHGCSTAAIRTEKEIAFFKSVFFPAVGAFLDALIDGGQIQSFELPPFHIQTNVDRFIRVQARHQNL